MENKFKILTSDIKTIEYLQWLVDCNNMIMQSLVDALYEKRLYKFCWGNNEKRQTMKGRFCIVLAWGKMNSCLIEFVDNGQKEVVSRNALRKAL